MKLNTMLITGFLVVALLVGVVGFITYWQSSDNLRNELEKKFHSEVGDHIRMIDIILHEKYELIQVMAGNPILSSEESTPEEITKELMRFKGIYGDEFTSLSFFDMNRIRIADTAGLHLGQQHEMVVYWERALEGKMTYGQDVRIAEELKIPIIYFASPVKNKAGKQFGVVVARFNPKEIQKQFEEAAAAAAEVKIDLHATLFDKDRNVIFSTDPYYKDKILKEKIEELPSVKLVLESKDGFIEEYQPHHGEYALSAYYSEKGYHDFEGNGWGMIMSAPREQLFAPITRLGYIFLIITVGAVALAMFLGLFISRSISKPIKKLTDAVDEISKGRLEVSVDKSNIYEVNKLTEALDRVLTTMKRAIKRVKDGNNK